MAIAVEQTVTGSATSGNTTTLTSWTPGSNELILVAIAQRDEAISLSVAGNGLTFVEIANVDNAQGQCGIALFRAMGSSPSTGSITVTHTGNTLPVMAVASRFSGVDTSGTNGSGAIEANTSDAGPPVTDDDDMLVSLTTLTDNAWAFGAGTHRGNTFAVPVDETQISINNTAGTGGDMTSCSTWYKERSSASTDDVGDINDLSSASDWSIIAVSIKPAAQGPSVSDSISVSESVGVDLPDFTITTSDSISAGESVGVSLAALAISASESVSVADSPQVIFEGTRLVAVSDSVSVADSPAVSLGNLLPLDEAMITGGLLPLSGGLS